MSKDVFQGAYRQFICLGPQSSGEVLLLFQEPTYVVGLEAWVNVIEGVLRPNLLYDLWVQKIRIGGVEIPICTEDNAVRPLRELLAQDLFEVFAKPGISLSIQLQNSSNVTVSLEIGPRYK